MTTTSSRQKLESFRRLTERTIDDSIRDRLDMLQVEDQIESRWDLPDPQRRQGVTEYREVTAAKHRDRVRAWREAYDGLRQELYVTTRRREKADPTDLMRLQVILDGTTGKSRDGVLAARVEQAITDGDGGFLTAALAVVPDFYEARGDSLRPDLAGRLFEAAAPKEAREAREVLAELEAVAGPEVGFVRGSIGAFSRSFSDRAAGVGDPGVPAVARWDRSVTYVDVEDPASGDAA